MNFTSKKNIYNSKTIKSVQKNTQKIQNTDYFYEDMKKFLNKEYSKDEYLKTFINRLEQSSYAERSNNVEKKYINDLLTSIDLANSYKEIPDNYIIERVLKIVGNQK